jgi:integrase
VALGVVRDLRSPRSMDGPGEAAAYQEHLMAEYVLARLAHGVADGTIRGEITAVEQFLELAGVFAWEIEPAHADRFLGQAQRHQAPETRRGKAGAIDLFFRFLEARYRGEIHELTGRVVASPIDACNRPRHSGDFHVRVPPSPQALAAFFASWRGELPTARKWLAAARHYAMARLAAETGLRLRELCGLRLEDLHFSHGPLGKIHVRLGKGSRGSGPRERMVPMLGDARPLLIWWVQDVRGQFGDDWELPRAVLFPSERGGPIGGDTFAAALGHAAAAHLRGPVTKLTPHVLRHACASRLYGEGIGLAAIQQLLGHRWLSTTVRYVHVADEAIESAYQQAAERAAARFREV